MSEKKRIRVFYISDGAEVSANLTVVPTATVSEQQSGNRLIRIGGGALEIAVPDTIFEQIRGH